MKGDPDMYWENAGQENTEATLKLAMDRARALGIKHLVIASNQGNTIQTLLEQHDTSDLNMVVVTHHVGFRNPGEDEMSAEIRQALTKKGVKILTTTHLLAGIDRGVRNHFGGVYPAEIIAQTLRIFGQGIKVAVEISSMALDAGLIPYGEDIIAIAGTARGADAAAVIRPAHASYFFQTEVREIICMPRNKKKAES